MPGGVTEYQITYWREFPSLVTAREGDDVAKSPLPQRFQEAIDEAAMRLGAVDSDAYLEGWRRADWVTAPGTPAEVAADVAARLDSELSAERIERMLEELT
jgi:Virulence factor